MSTQPYSLPAHSALSQAVYDQGCAAQYPGFEFRFVLATGNYLTTDNSAQTVSLDTPLNQVLFVCTANGVPTGWTQYSPATTSTLCVGLPGGGMTIQHTTCLSTDVVCNQPPNSISYSPNPVVVPYNQTSTNVVISYSAQGTPTCVYEDIDTTDPHKSVASICGAQIGSATFAVAPGHKYFFWVGNNDPITEWAYTPFFNVTQGSQPTLIATPNPVVVPFGKTSAMFDLAWNAPYYAQISLYGVQNIDNAGIILCLGNAIGAGNLSSAMKVGEDATIYLTPYTGCVGGSSVTSVPTPVLQTLEVKGLQGAAASLRASPNPVTIAAGQSSAPYTLSWSAAGYSHVTLYGSNNLISGGAILCLGDVAGSGSVATTASPGEDAYIYLTTQTSCVGGSIATPPKPYLAVLHVTTN